MLKLSLLMQRLKKTVSQIGNTTTMKIITSLLLIITMGYGCKKHDPTDCVQARVIRVTCASIVMQALNNNIGEDGWVDIYNNTRYDNVFTISNPCSIASEHKPGNTVYITIARATPSDCIRCALADGPPKISFDLKTIGSLPCNEN